MHARQRPVTQLSILDLDYILCEGQGIRSYFDHRLNTFRVHLPFFASRDIDVSYSNADTVSMADESPGVVAVTYRVRVRPSIGGHSKLMLSIL